MQKGVIFIILLLILLPLASSAITHEISEQTIPVTPKERAITIEHYIYGTGLIASVKGDEIKYYHKDNLGSTRAISDSNGNKVESINYLPYGESLNSNEERFTFTGKEQDSSGLSYFGARYYDSNLGRFTSVDPIKDGINYYAYANNNPLKFVDSSGLRIEIPQKEYKSAILEDFTELAGPVFSIVEEDGRYFLEGPSPEDYSGKYPNTYYYIHDVMQKPNIVQVKIGEKGDLLPTHAIYELESGEEVARFESKLIWGVLLPNSASTLCRGPETRPRDNTFFLSTKTSSGYDEIIYSENTVKQSFLDVILGREKRVDDPHRSPEFFTLAHELGHAFALYNGLPIADIPGELNPEDSFSLGPGIWLENIALEEQGMPRRTTY